MKKDVKNVTVLHDACGTGASYNIIKILIDGGGKDLVMAKDNGGYCIALLMYAYRGSHQGRRENQTLSSNW